MQRWSRIFCILLLCFLYMVKEAVAKPPNIVLILADDLGFTDTQPYGSEIRTPNLVRLAHEGVLFTNFHTAATCAPSRAMLLTGVDNHRAGVPDIPEAIPPELAGNRNYQGTLNNRVVTIATLLRDNSYHTYITGKWHLGKTADLLPSQRGFERTVALMESGADNWEQKSYAPLYKTANWYADGQKLDLPDDFYSSKFYIDKAIEFIESNRADGKPFFSYISFQAVHIPVQAPRAYTERYLGLYDTGWQDLRSRRLERIKELGLVPGDTRMVEMPTTIDWETLSEAQQRYQSRKMAVYAGMVEAMDHHIGRLIEYLKTTGQYENTVFVFTSDNGPQVNDIFHRNVFEALYGRLWLRQNGYRLDYDRLGTRGSYINMGISFASAAASPLAYYKFFAGEGGMRVPLIIAGNPVQQKGTVTNAFSFATDIAPTILQLAGVRHPGSEYRGRQLEVMDGKSLTPLLQGRAERIHGPDEITGYELGGNSALFMGDYKLVRNRQPVGDSRWHLFNYVIDPGETTDLSMTMPERFAEMQAAYRDYAEKNGVLEVPDDYDQFRAVTFFAVRRSLRDQLPFYAIAGLLILVLVAFNMRWRRKRRLDAADPYPETPMEKMIEKTLKPFLIVSGLITMAPVIIVFSPGTGLMQVFQLELVAEYTLTVQHWGLMIFLVGLLTVVSAFRSSLVFPVLLYSTLQKAGLVTLTVLNARHHYVEGFLQPAGFDLLCVLYALLYFHTLWKKRNREKSKSA